MMRVQVSMEIKLNKKHVALSDGYRIFLKSHLLTIEMTINLFKNKEEKL